MVRNLPFIFLPAVIALGPTAAALADEPKPRTVLKGHTDEAYAVAFSPDGKTLASSGKDGSVRVWDLSAGKESAVLTAPGIAEGRRQTVWALAFSQEGKVLAAGGDEMVIRLWDVTRGKETATLAGYGLALSFAPDGKTLAAGGGDAGVVMWDMGTLKRRDIPVDAGRQVVRRGLAYRPDGKMLVSVESTGRVVIRDGVSGDAREVLPSVGGDINPVAFSADGDLAYVGDAARATKTPRKAEKGRTIRVRYRDPDRDPTELKGHAGHVRALAFRPDGKALASAGEDVAVQWDLSTQKGRIVYDGKGRTMNCVVYSPDGTALAAAGEDGAVRVWDVADLSRPAK